MNYVDRSLMHKLPRVADFSPSQIAVFTALLVLLISVPVWTHPVPPLSDYANHLARMHVIATGAADQNLARYYQVDWQVLPNLVMDLIVPALGRLMSIYLAGQIFTVMMFALLITGTLALNRALTGRWSLVPLLAAPFVYNYVFLVGVMNYMFGIGLSLWAMAAWIMLRHRHWAVRSAVSTLFVVALFFCHLFAVGLYGMGLLAYESWRLWRTRAAPLTPRIAEFVSTGVPFLPVVPLLLVSPTMRLASDFSWEPRGKIDGLIYAIETYSDISALLIAGIMAIAAVWAVRHRVLRFHPVVWALLIVSGIVYMAMPRILFASYMADQRLPIAVAFMLIACADVRLHHRMVRRGFLTVLLTLVAIRLIEVDVSWSSQSASTMGMRSSIKRIKAGSKVLVSYADRDGGEDVRDLGLVHAACIAMIERSALVTTAFTVVGKQVLQVRPQFRDYVDTEDGTPPFVEQLIVAADRPETAQGQYWKDWTTRFDYLYVLFTGDEAENPDPQRLELVQNGDRFQLYKIKKPKPGPTAGSMSPGSTGAPLETGSNRSVVRALQ